jgi:transposase-like protein
MNFEQREKWLEAARQLAVEPTKNINCPECGKSNLMVKDVRRKLGEEDVERHMHCPLCNAYNALRLKRPI